MATALEILGGIAVIALIAWHVPRSMRKEAAEKKRKIHEAFSNRDSLTPEAFYDRYFREKGIEPSVVESIRTILQEQLGADLSRLSAEDDFSQNLSFFWDFDSMANLEIVLALEDHFQIKITDEEAQQTHTVSQLVQLVSSKLRGSNAP